MAFVFLDLMQIQEECRELLLYLNLLLIILPEYCQSAEFLLNNKTSINLQQGDLLLFNNWEVMHARDAFKLDKNNWRWLQRIYMMLNEFKH